MENLVNEIGDLLHILLQSLDALLFQLYLARYAIDSGHEVAQVTLAQSLLHFVLDSLEVFDALLRCHQFLVKIGNNAEVFRLASCADVLLYQLTTEPFGNAVCHLDSDTTGGKSYVLHPSLDTVLHDHRVIRPPYLLKKFFFCHSYLIIFDNSCKIGKICFT